MAQNKNALIRYKTIDKCLQNQYRKWTLEDLIEACSDALYEYEGRDINVSKRTVQMDIQMMRSDKLGYNAPIVVYEKKYYRYEDEDYTITDIPLTENDMSVLSETVEMLKQFKDFSLFSELGGIINKLEDKIHNEKSDRGAIIHLDKNENLKGLEHLDLLYQAILKEMVLNINYQSFKASTPSVIVFHPMLLKEFNNRWFLVGKNNKRKSITTLALDRMVTIDFDTDIEYEGEVLDGDEYYKNTVGVTVLPPDQVKKVILEVDASNAPYVLTKPMHATQRIIEMRDDGSVVLQIDVHLNFELERLILGFGESMKVIGPKQLRRRVKQKIKAANKMYKDKTDQ